MGLISKIEDKLAGTSKHENETIDQSGQQGGRSSLEQQGRSTKHNPLQHPVQSSTNKPGHNVPGSYPEGGAAGLSGAQSTGASGYGREAEQLQSHGRSGHGAGSTVPGVAAAASGLSGTHGREGAGYGREDNNVQSATSQLQNTSISGSHPSSNTQSTSGQYGTQPAQQSSTGQYTGQQGTGGQYGAQPGQALTTGQYGENQGHSSSSDHNVPRQPYDPYSSKGQQIAAAAGSRATGSGPTHLSQGRTDAQDYGSRSTQEGDVTRLRHGGISNGLEDQSLKSGPHPTLENRDAIPTAGGQKLGDVDQSYGSSGYDNNNNNNNNTTSGQQHHYGRDAAVAAGAAGAAETGHKNHGLLHRHHDKDTSRTTDHSSHSSSNPLASSTGASGQKYQQPGSESYNTSSSQTHSHPHSGIGSRHAEPEVSYMKHQNQPTSTSSYDQQSQGYGTQSDQSTHGRHHGHHGAEAGALGAGAGAGALGAGALNRDRHQHGSSTTGSSSYGTPGQDSRSYGGSSSNTTGSTGGLSSIASSGHSLAKKLGAAYEAGYRDALEHMKAERQQ